MSYNKGFVFCGSIFSSDGETGSKRTIYWNSEKMLVSIGYYKYQEANGYITAPETFTYFDWDHVPTFQEVIVHIMKGDKKCVEEYIKDINKESNITDLNVLITCGKLPYFENYCLYLYPFA